MRFFGKKAKKSRNGQAKAALTKKARQWKPASTENFHSSYWQPVTPCEGHAGIYVEAFCADVEINNGWFVRKMTVDNEGFATPQTMAKECCYFEALKHIGDFENSADTALSETPHEQQERDMPGLYFKDHADKSGLCLGEDCLPQLNIGGTPVGADNIRIAEKDLKAVKVLPPQDPTLNLVTIPALSGNNNLPLLREDFQITAHIAKHYDVDEQIALLDIEQRFKTMLASLDAVKSHWTENNWQKHYNKGVMPWSMRSSENYSATIIDFKQALSNLVNMDKYDEQLPEVKALRENLQFQIQIIYTAWFSQTAKEGNTSTKLTKKAKSISGYSKMEWTERVPHELQKLHEMIKSRQAPDGNVEAQVTNLNMVMPIVMADYEPKEFTELYAEFYERIEKLIENFCAYKQAKIQSYAQEALKKEPEAFSLPQTEILMAPQTPQGIS